MRRYAYSLLALGMAASSALAQTNDMRKEIIGHWQAGQTMIQQPPTSLWQNISQIAFATNGVVTWTSLDGATTEKSGRYILQTDRESKRGLPRLFVAPLNYPDPRMSSISLLVLTDVEIDFDARFPVKLYGRVLKCRMGGQDLVFVRREDLANHGLESTGAPPAAQAPETHP